MNRVAFPLLAVAFVGISVAHAEPLKGWREVKPENKAFTVWMPNRDGRQQTQTHTLKIPGKMPMKLVMVDYEPTAGPVYACGVVHLPPVLLGKVDGSKWFQIVRDAFLEGGKAKVKEQKDVNLAQFPGREFLITTPKEMRRLQVYVAPKRLFVITIEGKPAEMNSGESAIFIASFKVPGMMEGKVTVLKEKPKKEVLDAPTLTRLLADLRSTDGKTRQSAAEQLAKAAPTQRRREVASTLIQQLNDTNNFVQAEVKKAAMVWAVKENVPGLLALLTHDNRFVRGSAMDVLAAIKDQRGAQAVAQRLRSSVDRPRASQSLQDMGPIAEQAVLNQLKYPDAKVRLEACKVLSAVGTKASLTALQAAGKDSNAEVAKAAQDAAAKVGQRD